MQSFLSSSDSQTSLSGPEQRLQLTCFDRVWGVGEHDESIDGNRDGDQKVLRLSTRRFQDTYNDKEPLPTGEVRLALQCSNDGTLHDS